MKTIIVVALVAMLLGAAITRQFYTREVIKTVEHETIKDHIITQIREVDNKDGTKQIDTTVTDNRIAVDSKVSTDIKNVTLPNWFISGGLQIDRQLNTYNLHINRRILGPIFVGGFADTKGTVGVSVGFEF